jgi:hypothetical protein
MGLERLIESLTYGSVNAIYAVRGKRVAALQECSSVLRR